ncbi:MAG: zinc ribbon domain-containing protein [Thermoproteota archaeon]|nr:zinc ribbon domain-containing protein [Thermoproteota archaeon]
MRVFNGKVATEDYLSTHSLTFSTPEMTLRKFALWLGEEIDSPFNKGQQIPRFVAYLRDKGVEASSADYTPDISDSFQPSGAVTDMFRAFSSKKVDNRLQPNVPEKKLPEMTTSSLDMKKGQFCTHCGSRLRSSSKFCHKCGARRA